MTTTTKYELTMTQVQEQAAHLRSLVERGVYPQSLIDAYLAGVAGRTDA